MRIPSANELLTLWEAGLSLVPARRALLLAQATQTEGENAARWSAGRRDMRLFQLRENLFGMEMPCLGECPKCRERVEFSLSTDLMRSGSAAVPPASAPSHVLSAAGYRVEFTLPTSEDIAELPAQDSATTRRLKLLSRCVQSAAFGGAPLQPEDLPEEVVTALSARMAELDPQGERSLSLSCPACRHEWAAPFDIASYLWSELATWAARLLREIHLLAKAYGWREADILSLSPMRRHFYLQMATTA